MIRNLAVTVTLLLSIMGIAPADILPPAPDTIVIRDWLLAGPFSVGAREGITGIIDDPMTFRPTEGDSLRSGLVQGGGVSWHRVKADSLGWLETDYDSVRWDSIMDYYGYAGLLAAGYAWAEFEVPYACRALTVTHRGKFTLNGRGYQSDAYGRGWLRTPVLLDSGVNRVLLSISGFADRKVRLMFVPTPAPAMTLCRDATTPDVLADSATTAWFGIPVLNTTGSRLDSITLIISLDSVLAETTVSNLPSLGAKKIPLRVDLPALPRDSAGLVLKVSTRWQDYVHSDSMKLRIRQPDESHKVTFRSGIDNSCQYYGILYPKDYDPELRYGLILSLHGASVEASGLVNCYKPKDWAFVVCPTNRRPFGFDWQDWGRLDAIEVLDTILARLPIDPDRVTLTGHSMGGHGTWHVGLTHADRFAAAGVGAGWPSFQLYIPWFLQRTKIFAEPAQQAIRDMALAPDNTPAFLENALNLPYFILHGGDDDNVPTIHGRTFAAWLEDLDQEYTYKEVPGRKHWWSYDDGISVVDDPDMMALFESSRRDPGPRHVRFKTADLGQSNHAYWLTIDRVRTVGRLAGIEAWASDSTVDVNTRNVSQFSLDLDQRLFFPAEVKLTVDGRHLGPVKSLPARITLHRAGNRWKRGSTRQPRLHKRPDLYGPAKQTMFRRFLLVYGTADTSLTEYLRHAATQEAVRWWLRGNGCTEVLPDSEVTPELSTQNNLLLYGGPTENIVTRRLHRHLPLRIKEGELYLDRHNLGPDLAALFACPNPEQPDRLVLVRMGTDAKHTRLSMFWGLAYSGSGVPDFMVFDRTVKRRGWAGIHAAGFFGPDWKLDPASTYLRNPRD